MSAMDKINVKGLICLEAGTGTGNMTRWLAKNTWNTLAKGYPKVLTNPQKDL